MLRSLKKKVIVPAVLTAVMLMTSTGTYVSAKGPMFSDVTNPKDYYYPAVESLASRDILKGPGDGTFRPNEQITRAAVAKVICKSLNLPTSGVLNPGFNDVKPGDWFYPDVAALADKGVISKAESFRPNDPITRGEIAKMIVKAYSLTEDTSSGSFNDVNPDDWFAVPVHTLVKYGITKGETPTTFNPYGKVTRAQAVTFIYRTEEALNGGENPDDAGDLDIISIE